MYVRPVGLVQCRCAVGGAGGGPAEGLGAVAPAAVRAHVVRRWSGRAARAGRGRGRCGCCRRRSRGRCTARRAVRTQPRPVAAEGSVGVLRGRRPRTQHVGRDERGQPRRGRRGWASSGDADCAPARRSAPRCAVEPVWPVLRSAEPAGPAVAARAAEARCRATVRGRRRDPSRSVAGGTSRASVRQHLRRSRPVDEDLPQVRVGQQQAEVVRADRAGGRPGSPGALLWPGSVAIGTCTVQHARGRLGRRPSRDPGVKRAALQTGSEGRARQAWSARRRGAGPRSGRILVAWSAIFSSGLVSGASPRANSTRAARAAAAPSGCPSRPALIGRRPAGPVRVVASRRTAARGSRSASACGTSRVSARVSR